MKVIRTALSAFLASFILFAPVVLLAQTGTELQNPLKVKSISDFVAMILRTFVLIALPIIALFIVYSGFLFVWARGSQEGITKARNNFLYVIIGTILILGAWVIATLIGGTVTQLTNG